MFPLFQVGIANVNGVATLKGFEGIFANTVAALLAIAGILLFVVLIAGGFQYITSGGDPKKIEAARKTLTYAIAGIIAVALAFMILRFFQVLTGAPVTNFIIGN